MSFINKLNDTYELISRFDEITTKEIKNSLLKKQLLSISEDLAKYKNIDEKNIKLENDKIKLKITNILNRINEIEVNVKNKLIITEKYNLYLNS